MCVLTAPPTRTVPLLRAPDSLKHNNIAISAINNPTMASKCPGGRKSHTSLILNQKLGMITLSEEDMSKAKKPKARPLVPVKL